MRVVFGAYYGQIRLLFLENFSSRKRTFMIDSFIDAISLKDP